MNKRLGLLILSIIISTYHSTPECSSFEETKRQRCSAYAPENVGETCVLINNQCQSKNVYTDCESYSGTDSRICTEIIPNDNRYKCIYDSRCKSQLKSCEELDKNNCENIIGITPTRRCIYSNSKNKCEEHFDDCATITDQDTCKSNILLSYDTQYCDWTTSCILKYRTCKEYVKRSLACNNLQRETNEPNKQCIFDSINDECKYNYPSCSLATTEAECKTILPWDGTLNAVKYNYKCVWSNSGCIEKRKTCSEYQSIYEDALLSCSSFAIAGTDTQKSCVLINGNCIETYAICENYSGTSISRTVCEGIKLPSSLYKCVYDDSISPHLCKTQQKKCNEFEIESIKDSCENIVPDLTKKCIFSNDNCSEQKKTCLELASSSGVTKSICEAASTSDSSKKKCEINPDSSGCQEVDIPQEINEITEEPTETPSGAQNIKSKMIFGFICFLFL